MALPSCGRTDPSQQRYKDAAETSSHLIESVSDYMIWMNTPDDEVYCGLCGDGYDTWKEVQAHMFEAHYDMVKDDAKEWFKNG